ncbi:MAG: hypothetical protein Q8N42_00240 [bacterium]|nr:hypothetical protein [bacterium]
MAKQEIQIIKVKDLHLWSENPRDPVDPTSSDSDIIKRAIDENPKEWNLDKLVKEMGSHYDFSEIPTVVFIDDKPIIFDGNRRVAVLKYLQDRELYSSLTGRLFLKDGPKELRELFEIPCNVCDKDIALTNIERKHVNNGSWGTLQREYFLHQHRGQPKSLFLLLEEQTGLISGRPSLNQGFVKDEVFTEKNLKDIGFSIQDEEIVSNYKDEQQSKDLLEKVSSLIENKDITTRKNRGKLKQTLLERYPECKKVIVAFNDKKAINVVRYKFSSEEGESGRRTPITKQSEILFGKKLILKQGPVNDLYCGICVIYEKFGDQENVLPIIGMSLRLLLDVAGRTYYKDKGETVAKDDQISTRFINEAKSALSQKQKNSSSLVLDWVSGKYSLEGILHKYVHGSIDYSKQAIVQSSKVVADILEYYFKKEK